jgi:hypothetical protein
MRAPLQASRSRGEFVPYFVRIGKIEMNKSGVGSRGWYVRRRAKMIVVRWGSVDVVPAGSQVRFYLGPGWPKERTYPFRGIEAAIAFARAKIVEKLGPSKHDGGYDQLPPKQRIRQRPAHW